MNALRLVAAVWVCGAVPCLGQTGGGLVPMEEAALSSKSTSHMGRTALAIRASEWKHSETANYVYHYFDSFIATPVSVEAEAFYRIITADLGENVPKHTAKCHIYIFQQPEDWAAFVKGMQLDPWTGGLHSRGELFVLRDPRFKYKNDTLAHEVVHLVMDRVFAGKSLPLWVQEGYAEYAGGKAYAAYHRARGMIARPRSPAVQTPFDLRTLLAMRRYPADAHRVSDFYNHSHRLVRFLAGIDKEAFRRMLGLMADGRSDEAALREAFGTRFPSLTALEKEFAPMVNKE